MNIIIERARDYISVDVWFYVEPELLLCFAISEILTEKQLAAVVSPGGLEGCVAVTHYEYSYKHTHNSRSF